MKTQTQSHVGMGILIALVAIGTQACSKMDSLSKTSVGSTTSSVTPSSVTLKVTDPATSNVIYTDSGTSKTFSLVAGSTYTIKVTNASLPLGATVDVVTQNTSLPNSVATDLSAASGSVTFAPVVAGDYSVSIVVKDLHGDKILTKNYAAGVSCQSPTFTANSLNANGISVTGSNNLYSFSAAGVVSGANGQAPYKCAYDLSGVGIVDTGFTDCTAALSNQYVTLVNQRNIGVVVKDSCNTAYTVTKSVNLSNTLPTPTGNVFITGTVSAETGTATTDTRIKGAQFSSINTGGYQNVQPSFNGSTFSIQSYTNYGQSSSHSYGIEIDVSGIAGSFNLTTNPGGTVDMSSAVVSKITYATDQAGDQNPYVTMTGTTCTSSLHAIVQNPQGIPCDTGSTGGSKNQVDVEVYGTYTCTNVTAANGSSITVTGTFDGFKHLVDSCSGGGGGGGGIVPIKL